MTLKTVESGLIHSRSNTRFQNTVIEYSDKLRELIRDKLSDSLRCSQSLDSSYPQRLLQKNSSEKMSNADLEHLLYETIRLGDKMRKAGLLSSGDNVDVAIKSISDDNRRAIALYLADSVEKYKVLEPFADKLLLFLDSVNSKFQPQKKVEIDRKDGFKIVLLDGNIIHPGLLSSGEQHEIVLLCELIFFSKPGTLVLIDEPEISLHIDWQSKFVPDVEAIGKVSDLKFLLATHSPAIIGRRVDICLEI
jgi:predicted ATP-binding protein involved in virulence